MTSASQRILSEVARVGVLRPRDLDALGVAREQLARLRRSGDVERVGRGLYVLPGASAGEHQTVVEASRRVEHGVVCLLSALQFHGLTTQSPHEVWLAIGQKARQPRVVAPKLRIVRMSGESLSAGIESHNVAGASIRVFSPAKTVADCFKFRNKIGLDVALEALRDFMSKSGGVDDLWRFAKICRVANVAKPYLEALSID